MPNYIKSVLFCCLFGLLGCSVNPATGDRSFTGFMSLKDEANIGRREHPKIIRAYGGVYKEPRLNQYISKIGNALAKTSELPNIKWTFTILDSPQINAFAVPGGYIYVTRGLISLASSEAELSGVIAHEIGHITARHTAQRYSSSMVTSGLTMAASIFLGSIAGDAADLASNIAVKSYSRSQEFEADTLGVRYLSRNGYDLTAVPKFLSKLRANSKLEAKRRKSDPLKIDSLDIFATHPRTLDRVKRAIKNKESFQQGKRTGNIEYLKLIHNMPYGHNPEKGIVKGQLFIHSKLRFSFEVPTNYVILNYPNRVISRHSNGNIIQFDIAKKYFDGPLKKYISRHWLPRKNIIENDNIIVNGMEGATAKLQDRNKKGNYEVRVVAIRNNKNNRIYRFIFRCPELITAESSLNFRKTTYSLRNLSETDAKKITSNRIQVIPVRNGDTVKKLSNMMNVNRFKEETFRVLNGLTPFEKLRYGRLVKIIVS